MKTAYVVLGPHRSGTSSVAGALALLGATAPQTMLKPSDYNPKGYWESEPIMELGEEILASSRSSWQDWRPLTLNSDLEQEWHERAAELIRSEFGHANTIVLKDPRICRIYPFWEKVLFSCGYRPALVCPVRPPLEVARSLGNRRTINTFEQGLRLWLNHTLDAEAATRGRPRHWMPWTRFLSDWRVELALMSKSLGHEISAPNSSTSKIDDFLDHALHRQVFDEHDDTLERQWPLVAETHGAVLDLVEYGERPDIHDRLDKLQSEFHRQGRLYADAPHMPGQMAYPQ